MQLVHCGHHLNNLVTQLVDKLMCSMSLHLLTKGWLAAMGCTSQVLGAECMHAHCSNTSLTKNLFVQVFPSTLLAQCVCAIHFSCGPIVIMIDSKYNEVLNILITNHISSFQPQIAMEKMVLLQYKYIYFYVTRLQAATQQSISMQSS